MSDVVSVPAVAERPVARSVPAAAEVNETSFMDVLSALNPLQHIPVVGTLYRSLTGDTIPEAARVTGSMLFSGLVFGPIGLLSSAATAALGRITGLDPEEMGRDLLRGGPPAAAVAAAAAQTHAAETATARSEPAAATRQSHEAAATPSGEGAAPRPRTETPPELAATAEAAPDAQRKPLLPAQLAAYGVTRTASGALRRDDVEGADVLNQLELLRIGTPTAVAAAYGGKAPPAA